MHVVSSAGTVVAVSKIEVMPVVAWTRTNDLDMVSRMVSPSNRARSAREIKRLAQPLISEWE